MPGFHVEHFGCRAARADGEPLRAHLRVSGLNEEEPAGAALVIVNTCSVTAEADRAARRYIRRAHRLNPEARIVVTGCYAQRAPKELAELPAVAAVVGNSHQALVPEIALTENFLAVELTGSIEANRLVRVRVRKQNAEGALEAVAANPL
jgi:threonylcarbamoyladenosine tRNA methylthiotransferase MtaB